MSSVPAPDSSMFVFKRAFYQKRKRHNKSPLLCVLKTKNIHPPFTSAAEAYILCL